MMMRKLILFLIMIPVYSFSQVSVPDGYELSVESGIGSYAMPSLRDLQNAIMIDNPLGLIKTTSFPAYYNYSFRFGEKNGNNYQGIMGGIMSTGARASLADYSGYYVSDINCVALHLGYYFRIKLINCMILKHPFEMGYLLNGSILYSFVTLKDNLQLYGNDPLFNESNTINSIGVYTEPMLYAAYMFNKHIGLELNAGAAISISSPLYYKSIKNEVEINNKKMFANWSGYRLSIGLISRF